MSGAAVTLSPVEFAEKPELWRAMADYLVEHAALSDPDGVFDPLDYPNFDLYWHEPERRPYWVMRDGERVGFVLVNAWSPSGLGTERAIAEFCVLAPWRRRGLGLAAAAAVFASHTGLWELQVYRANASGMAFWPHAIAATEPKVWRRLERDDRVIHRFVTAA